MQRHVTIYVRMLKNSSCLWICPSCGLPSFSSSFFDSSDISTSNSFSPLNSVNEIGTPVGPGSFQPSSNAKLHSTRNEREPNTPKVNQCRPIKASTRVKPTSKGVKFVSINVNSLHGKSLEMLELIHSQDPDMILCQ